ncbi:hypothetical protein Tco_0499432 [Tanacetum coccineum]
MPLGKETLPNLDAAKGEARIARGHDVANTLLNHCKNYSAAKMGIKLVWMGNEVVTNKKIAELDAEFIEYKAEAKASMDALEKKIDDGIGKLDARIKGKEESDAKLDAKFEELEQLILGTAPSQSTHVDHVPQITKVPAKTAPFVPPIRRGYDDIELELHNSNAGSSTTIGKNLRPKYWDVEKFHKSIIAAIKEEKNQEEEGRVPSFRVQLNQRGHKSRMKAKLFWKKFVVACVRPRKPRKLFTSLGNGFESLDLHEQLQVCIRILKKIYQDYYLLLKHTKGIQRRTWDPGITWLKILKEHLEDKVFLRGGVMIRSGIINYGIDIK